MTPARRRILVTGGSGQLGTELRRAIWPAGTVLIAPTRAELDITAGDSVRAFLAATRCDVVINAAAYTAVDAAEADGDAAFAVNARGPANLAAAAAAAAIPMIHISTDYVFDGTKTAPYREDDPVNPINVYGASKAAGERAVREAETRAVILRTAWVVGAEGRNFVRSMLRLAAEGRELRIVDDQFGCPTAAPDLAEAIAAIAIRLADEAGCPGGTFHFVNAGATSWYDLARHAFAVAARYGHPAPRIAPIATADYPTAARRPLNSRLCTKKLELDYGIVPRPWQGAIEAVVAALSTGGSGRGQA